MKRGLTIGVATLLGALALAPAAQAQTDYEVLGKSGGISYARESFFVPSSDESAVSVRCPGEDQFAFSGGAELFGGPAATYLSSQSAQVNFGWTSRGWDAFGLGGSNAEAFSICGKFELGELSGFSSSHGVPPGPATESQTTECGAGKILSGGGFFAGTNTDNWYLNSSYPKQNGWEWVGFHLDSGDTNGSEIIGEAYCVKGEKPDIVKKSVKSKKEHVKLKVFCKRGVVTGGGASASKDASNAHLVKTIPIDSKDDRKAVPDDGWAIEYENDGIVKQTFTAYAVCR